MWLYAKAAIAVVLTISLFWGGWKANGWRIEAGQLQAAKLELRNELERRVSSDAARLAMARKLAETEAQVIVETKVVKERIVQRVPDIRGCDLVDLGGLLNPSRAGMPSAAERATDTPSPP